jgi:hypothetical protein
MLLSSAGRRFLVCTTSIISGNSLVSRAVLLPRVIASRSLTEAPLSSTRLRGRRPSRSASSRLPPSAATHAWSSCLSPLLARPFVVELAQRDFCAEQTVPQRVSRREGPSGRPTLRRSAERDPGPGRKVEEGHCRPFCWPGQ